jgi:hypothetical protein
MMRNARKWPTLTAIATAVAVPAVKSGMVDSVAGRWESKGQPLRHFRHRDVEPDLALLQDGAEEEAAGTGRVIDAGVGQLLLGDQVQQVGLDLLGIEPVRSAAVDCD